MAKKRNLKMWVVMAVFLLAIVSTAGAEIIYVDADASTGGDGTSWGTAYKYLQDALYKPPTSGDEIWVAEGTYKPDANTANPGGTGSRTATFQLINGVAIKGGYAGSGQPDPNAWDVELYETILSGDLDGNDVQVDPCDLLTEPTRGENSYHVVTGSGTNATAILEGFTISAGNANGPGYWDRFGGGMYNEYGGSPTVINCIFKRNSASSRGGGMYNYEHSSPIITNCTFSGNSAEQWGGGGVAYESDSSPKITNCTFRGNSAGWGGGGLYLGSSFSDSEISNCIISNNTGGGISLWWFFGIIKNCIIAGNIGGGIFADDSDFTVTNCTFVGNEGNFFGNEGSGIYIRCFDCLIKNCMFWENAGIDIGYNEQLTVIYSDVQGGWGGTGNIDEDPLFIDPNGLDGIGGTADDEEGYVHLRGYSPCINAGDPAGDYSGQVDIDGQPRVAYGRVDMGADEVFPIAGDFEPDGDVDFAIFANHWLLGVE